MNKNILSLTLALLLLLSCAAPALAAEDAPEYHAATLYRTDGEQDAAFWTVESEPFVQYVEPSLVPQLYPGGGWTYDPDARTLSTADGGAYEFDVASNTISMLPSPPTNLVREAEVPVVHPAGSEDDLQSAVVSLDGTGYRLREAEGKLLVPLPVIAVLFTEVRYDNLFSDGKNLYLSYMMGTQALIEAHRDNFSDAWGRDYSAENPADQARILANYRELCLRFDLGYGLPAVWAVGGFDAYLTEAYPEIKALLLSGNGLDYVYGLIYLTQYAVADGGHTALYRLPYPMSGLKRDEITELLATFDRSAYQYDDSASRSAWQSSNYAYYGALRSEALGDGVNETVRYGGDTAVITFDQFIADPAPWDGWEAGTPPEDGGTVTFFYNCFQDIAAHPEVEKVVIDLTNNVGGVGDVVMDIMGYLQNGVSTVTLRSGATGSSHTELYEIDTNLDGKADEQDGYEGRYRFYILTSEVSFSCGNLLPALAKEQGAATLVGHRSAGGSCPVLSMWDLYGAQLSYSGDWSLHVRDGEGRLVSIDGGVEPDFWLPDSVFYDIPALSAAIDAYENRQVPEQYDAERWALEHGVAGGALAGVFSPDAPATRAQAVTWLWSAAGRPQPELRESPFADVTEDTDCLTAVLWAYENGIAKGAGADSFCPEQVCSYAELLTFLWRTRGEPGTAGGGVWYGDALDWAAREDLLRDTAAADAVTDGCTGADAVVCLYRCFAD